MAAQNGEMTVTIPNGQTNSPEFMIGQFRNGTIQLPAALDGATVTVQFSNDKTNWTEALELAPETNPITFVANATVLLPASMFLARWGRLAAAAGQTANRDFKLYFKD